MYSRFFQAPCLENIKIGSCSTYSERYYFDIIDRECKKFFYAGCGGNRNNFASQEECVGVCLTSPPIVPKAVDFNRRVDSSGPKESFIYKRPSALYPKPTVTRETTAYPTTESTTSASIITTTMPSVDDVSSDLVNIKLSELNSTKNHSEYAFSAYLAHLALMKHRSLWLTSGYHWSLWLTSGYHWSLWLTTGYRWSLELTTGYHWSLWLTTT